MPATSRSRPMSQRRRRAILRRRPVGQAADGGDPAGQLGRCPAGRRHALVGRVGEQPAHEIRDDRADRSQLSESQRGQGHHRDPAPGGGLRDQRYTFGVQRQVGQADRDVPPSVGAPAGKIVEQRLDAAVASRRHLTPAFPDGPPHVRVHPLAEPPGQLVAEPGSHSRRVVGRGRHQSDDDLRRVLLAAGHPGLLTGGRAQILTLLPQLGRRHADGAWTNGVDHVPQIGASERDRVGP